MVAPSIGSSYHFFTSAKIKYIIRIMKIIVYVTITCTNTKYFSMLARVLMMMLVLKR